MAELSSSTLQPDWAGRRPLRDEAYLLLRRAILSGRLKPGDHLVEREVAGQLGLSRSPIREAFRKLEQERLVIPSRQGVVVKGLDLAEVSELYQIRRSLEVLVARLAAHRCTCKDTARLEAILDSVSGPRTETGEHSIVQQGVVFHQALAQLAGNHRLALLLDALGQEIDRFRTLTMTLPARTPSALQEHREILEAIAANDEQAAVDRMGSHIDHAHAFTCPHTG